MMKTKSVHSGQIAIIMILVITVLSALAVTLAGQAIIETRIQETDVESTRALMAAQAGLENLVANPGNPTTGTLEGAGDYDVSVTTEGEDSILPRKYNPGETLSVNLTGALAGLTGVSIYWNPDVTGNEPAIFVSDVRGNTIVDYAYDRTGANGFTAVATGGSFGGNNYAYKTDVNINNGVSKTLQITVLGNAAVLAVVPIGAQLPAQTTSYKSTGSVTTDKNRTVKYGLQYTESRNNLPPQVFNYALFSGGNIIQ